MSVKNTYLVGDMSPALLYNNLAYTAADGACFYASGTHVCCARTGTSRAEPMIQMSNAVVCVRAVSMPDQPAPQPLILVASSMQCLLFRGSETVASFDEVHGSASFASCCDVKMGPASRGVVAHIAIGSTSGGVLFAECTPSAISTGGILVNKSPLQMSHEGVRVTAVAVGTPGGPRELAAATGDGKGRVLLWTSGDQATPPAPYAMIPTAHDSDCVTSLAIVAREATLPITSPDAAVAVAYGCGKVRLYGIAAGDLRLEICAHSKWINAIQYSPLSHSLATTGEDSTVQVFRLPTTPGSSSETTALIASAQIPNALPTGVDFSASGRSVIVAAFNMPALYGLDF